MYLEVSKNKGEVSLHLVLASGVLLCEGMKSHFLYGLLFIYQQINRLCLFLWLITHDGQWPKNDVSVNNII